MKNILNLRTKLSFSCNTQCDLKKVDDLNLKTIRNKFEFADDLFNFELSANKFLYVNSLVFFVFCYHKLYHLFQVTMISET